MSHHCYGFLNYLDGAGLWPDQQGGQRCDSGVAILTQSSNIAINLTMQHRGLPVAYAVTAGNQAQLGLADLGEALLQDDRVTALAMHIEGVGDLRAFEAMAATSQHLCKPIVALKAGQSETAQAATISHTASLAGSAAGASALFRHLGIAEVSSLTEMVELLKLLHVAGPLPSRRIASMSCSGGEASLMADAILGHDLDYPPLAQAQKDGLRRALGSKVALANPLDYHTYIWNDAAGMTATYSAMMQGDLALGLVVADFPRADRCKQSDWEPVIQGAKAAQDASGRQMGILATLPENMPEDVARRLIDLGLVPFCGIQDAMTAIARAAWVGQERPAAQPIILPQDPGTTRQISEAEAKAALARFGVVCPRATRSDLAGLADVDIPFPCVVNGEGIAHKTEAGAVALNIASSVELVTRGQDMPCETFLVEEMICDVVAELLVGVVRDPAHGFVLTLAAGGTLTEVLQDSVSQLLPATRNDVAEAIRSLKVGRLIAGFRGAHGANLAPIVDAVMAIQDYVVSMQGKLEEVEVNPLMITPDRAVAADALIRCRDA